MSILGKVTPTGTSYTKAYTVPSNKTAVATVAVTNIGKIENTVSIALSGSDDLSVASITATSSGKGLTSIPTITIKGDGSGATAKVTALSLAETTIVNGGSGYVVGDSVTLNAGTNDTAPTVTVTGVDTSGTVTSISISSGGALADVYSKTITTTDGTGTGLTLDDTASTYGIAEITIVDGGNNYTKEPTVTVSDGTGIKFSVQMTRAAIEDSDVIEWKVLIPPSGVLERTGITLSAGDAIFVKSAIANGLNTFVFGIEAIA